MTNVDQKANQTGSVHVIIIVVAVLIVVGGIGAYLFTGGFGGKTVTATTSTEVKQLFANVKAGKYDAKCTYDGGTDNSSSLLTTSGTSTMYMSGSDKILVDTTLSGKSSHVLYSGKFTYIWADGSDKGSKLPVKDSTDSSNKFASNAKEYNIECQSTHLASSLFALPTDVSFTDINSQFKSETN